MTTTDAATTGHLTELPAVSRSRAGVLWAELVLVFFGLPALFAAYVDPLRRFDPIFDSIGLGAVLNPGMPRPRVLLPAIVIFSLVLLALLLFDRTFPKRQLWNFKATKRELPRILAVFAAGAAFMFAVAWSLAEFTTVLTRADGVSAFLFLPRELPYILLFIAIGYPWLSCYPQEVTHRAFFFHRYRPILPGRWTMIAVNAAAFTWLHAPFWSLAALLLTLPGGVLFAWTYERTKSTLAVTIEHALFGWWAFFIGLGYFVFAGAIGS